MWKLCELVRDRESVPLEELLVVFVSNGSRTVRGARQRPQRKPPEPVSSPPGSAVEAEVGPRGPAGDLGL